MAGDDPLADADLSLGAVIDNHIQNARACAIARQQLEALIRWHREATTLP